MDIALAMAVSNVADRASSYAMPGVAVDGNDVRDAPASSGDPWEPAPDRVTREGQRLPMNDQASGISPAATAAFNASHGRKTIAPW